MMEATIKDINDKYPFLKIEKCIGRGMFSHVYVGRYNSFYPVAIKIFNRDLCEIHNTEFDIHRYIGGCPYIIEAIGYEKIPMCLILEYFPSTTLKMLKNRLNIPKIRSILKNVLMGLDYLDEKGIIHCDIQLDNILVSPNEESAKIIDFGCACYAIGPKSTKIGNRFYRAPEVLLEYPNYQKNIDIWSLGTSIFFLLNPGEIPWNTTRTITEPIEMSKIWGKRRILDAMKSINHNPPKQIIEEMSERITMPFMSILEQAPEALYDQQLFNLVEYMMTIDSTKRPSASEVLKHPFFNE